jgi:hypothetical protein
LVPDLRVLSAIEEIAHSLNRRNVTLQLIAVYASAGVLHDARPSRVTLVVESVAICIILLWRLLNPPSSDSARLHC